MVASRLAWAAVVQSHCASIALPLTRGEQYEDLAVFTELAFRGMGLSPACVGKLLEDIRGRGRIASWGSSARNLASLRVAEKMGFQKDREDYVFVTGVDALRARLEADRRVRDQRARTAMVREVPPL